MRESGNVPPFERMGFRVESEGIADLFESVDGASLSEVLRSKRAVRRPTVQRPE